MGDTGNFQTEKWWHKSFSMLGTNLREVDIKMNVEKVASYISQHGADAWLIGVGGIQAQYPTALLAPLHSQRAVQWRPYCGCLCRFERAGGASVDGDGFFVSKEVAEEHPEWCYVSPVAES
jgi:hypothetical protein